MAESDKLVNGAKLSLFAQKIAATYATQATVEAAVTGRKFKGNVANITALKAIAKPAEGDTYTVTEGQNKVYQFDADRTETADSSDGKIIVPTDGTAGAFVYIATLLFSDATQSASGLMSATDKTKLDGLEAGTNYYTKSEINTKISEITGTSDETISDVKSELTAEIAKKVDKVTGKGLSTNDYTDADKAKVDAIDSVFTATEKTKLGDMLGIQSVVGPLAFSEAGALSIDLSSYATTDAMNSAIEAAKYTLPTASADTLGGVKIGSGLSITSGVLSVNTSGTSGFATKADVSSAVATETTARQNADTALETAYKAADTTTLTSAKEYTDAQIKAKAYTLPTATTTVLGGVKAGEVITVDSNGVLGYEVVSDDFINGLFD